MLKRKNACIAEDANMFYRRTAADGLIREDGRGMDIEDMLVQNEGWLRYSPNAMKWLFPLPEDTDGPGATPETLALIREDHDATLRAAGAFFRVFSDHGFSPTDWEGRQRATLKMENPWWIRPKSPSYANLARVIAFLTMAGLPDQADMLYQGLRRTYSKRKGQIPRQAMEAWEAASKRSYPPLLKAKGIPLPWRQPEAAR